MTDRDTAKILEFLVPGFLHGMGNALFLVQAQAQLLGRGAEQSRDESASMIETACVDARGSLELLRLVTTTHPDEATLPAGAALQSVVDPMRIGLRESGLAIDVDATAFDAADPVRHGLFVRSVALAAAEIHEALPTGSQGTFTFRWIDPRVLRIAFRADAEQLPFEPSLDAGVRSVGAWLAPAGGRVQLADSGFVLTFPDARSPL